MKALRLFTVLTMLLLLSTQVSAREGNSFGLKAGLDLWRINEVERDWRPVFTPGFSAGFFTEKAMASIFAIQMDINFLYSRGKIADRLDAETFIQYREMLAEAAIIPKFFFEINETLTYFVYIAPAASFGIIPYIRTTNSGIQGAWEEESIENWAYKINFSVLFGMGLEISGFILDFRYSLGFIDRNPDPSFTRKASRLVFSTGYKF